jgi:hypothetical protein
MDLLGKDNQERYEPTGIKSSQFESIQGKKKKTLDRSNY